MNALKCFHRLMLSMSSWFQLNLEEVSLPHLHRLYWSLCFQESAHCPCFDSYLQKFITLLAFLKHSQVSSQLVLAYLVMVEIANFQFHQKILISESSSCFRVRAELRFPWHFWDSIFLIEINQSSQFLIFHEATMPIVWRFLSPHY